MHRPASRSPTSAHRGPKIRFRPPRRAPRSGRMFGKCPPVVAAPYDSARCHGGAVLTVTGIAVGLFTRPRRGRRVDTAIEGFNDVPFVSSRPVLLAFAEKPAADTRPARDDQLGKSGRVSAGRCRRSRPPPRSSWSCGRFQRGGEHFGDRLRVLAARHHRADDHLQARRSPMTATAPKSPRFADG